MANFKNQLKSTPLAQDFLEYLQRKNNPSVKAAVHNGRALGKVPAPIQIPQVKMVSQKLALPKNFDLREAQKVSPVRDQGNMGSCWAFATYGALESELLPGESSDFSENNLIATHGYDAGPDEGGNYQMAAAYLSRWSGPINEADDPYLGIISPSPGGLSPQKHVQEMLFLPQRQSALDNRATKAALMNYGAAQSEFFWNKANYQPTTAAYYGRTVAPANHDVTLVGWDDTFSKHKFAPNVPKGNGAFIVKNSWGTDFGIEGYFYISYYDPTCNAQALYIGVEDAANYTRIYQYDELGLTSTVGYENNANIWMANLFRTDRAATIKAVAFYTLYSPTNYEIVLDTDVGNLPTPASRAARGQMGTIRAAGYHTIELTNPLKVEANQQFAIVIKLNTPGYASVAAVEQNIPGYSSKAVSQPGESFVSADGQTWEDLHGNYGNLCIKAFASD